MPKSYKNQAYLIETMSLLKENPDDKTIVYENKMGICHGLAMMALQAFLCDKLEEFNQRIDEIYEMYLENINTLDKLKKIQKNIIKRRQQLKEGEKLTLTTEEQKIIDLWAFFDGIALFQEPLSHEDVFEKKLWQRNSEKVAPYVASAALEQQGGLVKIGHWSGKYTLAELKSYLSTMTQLAKHNQQNVALFLETGPLNRPYGHCASLCWDNTKKKWLLINANALPIQEFNDSDNDIDNLAKNIFSTFWDKKITAFQTSLYTVDNNKQQSERFFKQLRASSQYKKIRKKSPSKEHRLKEWDLINSTCIAACNDNVTELNKLIKEGAQLNEENLYYKKTPLYLAIDGKSFNVVKELINNEKVNLNLPRKKNGWTPLHKAVHMQSAKMIRLLLEKGADPHIPDNRGKTALDYMAKSNKGEIFKFFVEKCDDLQKLSKLLTRIIRYPYAYPVDMIDLLIKKLNSSDEYKEKLIPLFVSLIRSKSPQYLRLLIKHDINLDIRYKKESLLSIAKKNEFVGFKEFYDLISAKKKNFSDKTLSRKFNKNKDVINWYLAFLNEEDRKEGELLLVQFTQREALQKLSLFQDKSSFPEISSQEKEESRRKFLIA